MKKKQARCAQHNRALRSHTGFLTKVTSLCSGLDITPCWPHSIQNKTNKTNQNRQTGTVVFLPTLKIVRCHTQIWVFSILFQYLSPFDPHSYLATISWRRAATIPFSAAPFQLHHTLAFFYHDTKSKALSNIIYFYCLDPCGIHLENTYRVSDVTHTVLGLLKCGSCPKGTWNSVKRVTLSTSMGIQALVTLWLWFLRAPGK